MSNKLQGGAHTTTSVFGNITMSSFRKKKASVPVLNMSIDDQRMTSKYNNFGLDPVHQGSVEIDINNEVAQTLGNHKISIKKKASNKDQLSHKSGDQKEATDGASNKHLINFSRVKAHNMTGFTYDATTDRTVYELSSKRTPMGSRKISMFPDIALEQFYERN